MITIIDSKGNSIGEATIDTPIEKIHAFLGVSRGEIYRGIYIDDLSESDGFSDVPLKNKGLFVPTLFNVKSGQAWMVGIVHSDLLKVKQHIDEIIWTNVAKLVSMKITFKMLQDYLWKEYYEKEQEQYQDQCRSDIKRAIYWYVKWIEQRVACKNSEEENQWIIKQTEYTNPYNDKSVKDASEEVEEMFNALKWEFVF